MSEEKKILEMIEKGQISSQEGMELLEALRGVEEEVKSYEKTITEEPKLEPKFLKIRVVTEKGETKVNVNIPLKIIKALGGILPHANNLIPENVQDKMEDKGINLNKIDFDQILQALELGELEETTLLDVEVNDEKDGNTQVKIYVE
ncbi:MAG: hypothetical protein N4A50_05690 [Vallitalea sp.]|jgi:hypothetical protein|nr:hypothetical protein [Vallitalea sp.]